MKIGNSANLMGAYVEAEAFIGPQAYLMEDARATNPDGTRRGPDDWTPATRLANSAGCAVAGRASMPAFAVPAAWRTRCPGISSSSRAGVEHPIRGRGRRSGRGRGGHQLTLGPRCQNAARWDAALPAAVLPRRSAEVVHSYHQYTVRLPDRASAQAMLASAGIETRVYYDPPVHLTSPYADLASHDLPNTDAAAASVLAVPVGPHLDGAERDRIAFALARL